MPEHTYPYPFSPGAATDSWMAAHGTLWTYDGLYDFMISIDRQKPSFWALDTLAGKVLDKSFLFGTRNEKSMTIYPLTTFFTTEQQ
jgi:hypothetical protein